ncbi:hypothetical protein L7F22_049251 [Adiantum nelumboides]|nr:hypothetical protein [Adiantum nelumboides]
MTYHQEWLKNLTYLSSPLEVSLGDDSTQPAQAYGDVEITLPEGRKVIVPQVYYVPGLRKNLISVSELTDQGLKMEFSRLGCHIHARAPSGQIFTITCPRRGKLYPLGNSSTSAYAFATIANTTMQAETLKWHYRLGHISQHALHQMKNRQLALGLPKQLTSISLCEGCIIGKATQKPFPNSLSRTSHPLALVHSDLYGPLPVQSLTGHKYFLTFIDDYFRYTFIYFLSEISSTLPHFQRYKAQVENHTGRLIQRFRSDQGGEYTSNAFCDLCHTNGILHEFSIPIHLQQNGVAERKNHT